MKQKKLSDYQIELLLKETESEVCAKIINYLFTNKLQVKFARQIEENIKRLRNHICNQISKFCLEDWTMFRRFLRKLSPQSQAYFASYAVAFVPTYMEKKILSFINANNFDKEVFGNLLDNCVETRLCFGKIASIVKVKKIEFNDYSYLARICGRDRDVSVDVIAFIKNNYKKLDIEVLNVLKRIAEIYSGLKDDCWKLSKKIAIEKISSDEFHPANLMYKEFHDYIIDQRWLFEVLNATFSEKMLDSIFFNSLANTQSPDDSQYLKQMNSFLEECLSHPLMISDATKSSIETFVRRRISDEKKRIGLNDEEFVGKGHSAYTNQLKRLMKIWLMIYSELGYSCFADAEIFANALSLAQVEGATNRHKSWKNMLEILLQRCRGKVIYKDTSNILCGIEVTPFSKKWAEELLSITSTDGDDLEWFVPVMEHFEISLDCFSRTFASVIEKVQEDYGFKKEQEQAGAEARNLLRSLI